MSDSHPYPLVTIGVPNYNHGRFLRQAVESALAQDYPNLEVLVSDNASTDDSTAVLASFTDPRLRWWRNDTNLGVYPNWDRLVREARGEFFKILQSDDWLEPAYVRTCIAAIQATGADCAFPGFKGVGDRAFEVLPSLFGHEGPYVMVPCERIAEQIAEITVFVHPTIGLFRATLVPEGYGGDSMSLTKDSLYWAKAVIRGRAVFINQALAVQRFHSGQDRRRKDTSRGAGDLIEAFSMFLGMETKGVVPRFLRQIARTYARSMLANLLRGQVGIALRTGVGLAHHGRLWRGVVDALLWRPPAGSRGSGD